MDPILKNSEVWVQELRGQLVFRRRGVAGLLGALFAFLFGGFFYSLAIFAAPPESAFSSVAVGIAAALAFLGLLSLLLGLVRHFAKRAVFDRDRFIFQYGVLALPFSAVAVEMRERSVLGTDFASMLVRFQGREHTLIPGVSGSQLRTVSILTESLSKQLGDGAAAGEQEPISEPEAAYRAGLIAEENERLEVRVVAGIVFACGMLWAATGFLFFPNAAWDFVSRGPLLWPLGLWLALPGLVGLCSTRLGIWFRDLSERMQTFFVLLWFFIPVLIF